MHKRPCFWKPFRSQRVNELITEKMAFYDGVFYEIDLDLVYHYIKWFFEQSSFPTK